MATVTIKNMPESLLRRLRERAQANRRSVDEEIVACIESAVSPEVVDVEEILRQARELREKTAHYVISDSEFNELKQAGRP